MATPPMVPAGWYADPAGRHEYRYWDGTYWTAGVADGGITAADPFPARVVAGDPLDRFTGGAKPIVDAHAEPSPAMPPEVFA